MARRRHLAKALAGVQPGTVLDAYTERYGVHKGALRAAHFAQMALVAIEHGPEWSASEYARYWAVDARTAYAHRAEAVEVFGENWRDVLALVVDAIERQEQPERAPGRIIRLAVPTLGTS